MKPSSVIVRWILIVALAACPTQAFGWSALGHKTVAEITWRQLDPVTQQNIVEILRRHPRFDIDFASKMDDKSLDGSKAAEDQWIFLQAAIWPDEIRKVKDFDHPEWHYISLPMYLNKSDEQSLARTFQPNLATSFQPRTPLPLFSTSASSIRGATAVALGGSTITALSEAQVPVRKVIEETCPSPMPRSERTNRMVPPGTSDWSGWRTMLGLNKAAASNEYSSQKYAPMT